MNLPEALAALTTIVSQLAAPEIDLVCSITETTFLDRPYVEDREIVVRLQGAAATISGSYAEGSYDLHEFDEVRASYFAEEGPTQSSMWTGNRLRSIHFAYFVVDRFTGQIQASAFDEADAVNENNQLAYLIEGSCRSATPQF
jgi:hypothetical protein